MAEQTRSEKRQRRSDARKERRSLAAKPFEALDEAAGAEAFDEAAGADESEGPGRETLKHVAATAALGAVVAGVAGAAKALADRRGDQPPPKSDADANPNESEDDLSEGPAGEQAAGADTESDDDHPEAQDEHPKDAEQDDEQASGDEEQPQAAAEPDEAEAQSQPEEPAEQDEQPQGGGEAELDAPREQGEEAEPEGSQNEPETQNDGADGSGPPAQKGASTEDVKKIVEEAKRELQELLGAEPERVSGFDRSEGRWTVTLEVVDVHRVPETTDVMASYEVAFDDDRNLVSVSELRRYRRSQVEER